MHKKYTYAPMARTNDESVLFIQNNVEHLRAAEDQFVIWENHYHYKLIEAWVDVYDGDQKINTIVYDKCWVPTVNTQIEESYPELLGKTLRQIVAELRPSSITDDAEGGVLGCPSDYSLFSKEYDCTPNHSIFECRSHEICTACWNQRYKGEQKRRQRNERFVYRREQE